MRHGYRARQPPLAVGVSTNDAAGCSKPAGFTAGSTRERLDDRLGGTLLGCGEDGGAELLGCEAGSGFVGVAPRAGTDAVRAVVAGFSTMRIGSRSPASPTNLDGGGFDVAPSAETESRGLAPLEAELGKRGPAAGG